METAYTCIFMIKNTAENLVELCLLGTVMVLRPRQHVTVHFRDKSFEKSIALVGY